jgi:hypothetical protein
VGRIGIRRVVVGALVVGALVVGVVGLLPRGAGAATDPGDPCTSAQRDERRQVGPTVLECAQQGGAWSWRRAGGLVMATGVERPSDDNPVCPLGGEPPFPFPTWIGQADFGYVMLERSGQLHGFGDVTVSGAFWGDARPYLADELARGVEAVDVEIDPGRFGYRILDSRGCVFRWTSAHHLGNVPEVSIASLIAFPPPCTITGCMPT